MLTMIRNAALLLALACLCAPLPARAAPAALPPAEAQTDVGSLHVLRFSHAGDPVIFLPGLATGPWEWADLIRRLSPRYSVYAVALPGFDGRPAATPPLFERATRDFWSLLDAQRIARPVVVGHSLGGTLALLLGEPHPERLRGIVALDGLPILPGMERVSAEQRSGIAAQTAAQIAGESHQQLLDYEKRYMNSAGGVLDASLAATLAELEATSDPAAVAQWLREDLTSDTRGDLAKISVPVLEIVPYNAPDLANAPVKYSEDEKAAYYRTLLAGVPHLQVVTVSPARHFAMYDQPDRLFTLVDAFLRQTR